MEPPEELRKWVEILTTAEKRFVKILGKARSGAKDSQQLELFDWINQTSPGEILPADTGLAKNLATVSNRLKDLILDSDFKILSIKDRLICESITKAT